MLASEITNLTSLGLRCVTRRVLTAILRVKVATGRVAATISRDWVLVDVVHCVLLDQI